jgi:hypothetical protein
VQFADLKSGWGLRQPQGKRTRSSATAIGVQTNLEATTAPAPLIMFRRLVRINIALALITRVLAERIADRAANDWPVVFRPAPAAALKAGKLPVVCAMRAVVRLVAVALASIAAKRGLLARS